MLSALTLTCATSLADENKPAADTTKSFYRQVELIQAMQPYVERVDLARLLLIKTSVTNVIQNIESNAAAGKNPVTMETMRLLQNVIVQYRFSSIFFGWQDPIPVNSIYAPIIADKLHELHKLAKDLEGEYGFDDSPYTQITAQTFQQIHKLLQQLETLPIPDYLKSDLRKLWPAVGETVAIALQGDRPKAFEKAVVIIGDIRKHYPEFNQIASSAAGFSLVMELQGLAEFYAEYAQMN
ncbi:MAG: hypothetical protein ACXWQE_05250 [Bdellovibrionales bacterium]